MTRQPPASESSRTAPRRAGRIRAFVEGDVPHVTELHRVVWPGVSATVDAYHEYFRRVFLENPSGDPTLPSLVHEDGVGRITGFVGVVPRRMAIDGQTFRAAVSSQFIVDPSSHVGLVAVRLAKAFLDGPQDLSIADEANDVSRTIWEGLGGTTAWLLSLYWTRPLRPARLMLSHLGRRPGYAAAAAVARPLAAVADRLVLHAHGSPFREHEPSVSVEDLCASVALARMREMSGTSSLCVEYDEHTFQWLLDRVASRRAGGRPLTAAIRDGRRLVGWYVGHLTRDGVADVAQLAATPSSIHDVLDHLFHDASRHGALAVSGRLDPRLVQALSDRHCLFHRRGPWVLISAKRPELVRSFESGQAWFSPLDGEWSLRFMGS